MIYRSVLIGGAILLTSAACQTVAPDSHQKDSAEQSQPSVKAPASSLREQPLQILGPQTIEKIETERDFKLWFTYYYIDPKPDLVSEAVTFMATHNYMAKDPDIVSSFLGQVFALHPDHVKDWLKSWNELDRRSWSVILISLWFSGQEEAKLLFRVHLNRAETSRIKDLQAIMNSNQEPDLLDLQIHDPRQINLLWAAFSANGDDRIIEKIISYIQNYQTQVTSLPSAIAEAAIVSLATNSLHHKKVVRVCETQQQSNPSPKIRILLEAMLATLKRVREADPSLSH